MEQATQTPSAPAPTPTTVNPGRGLGIASLVVSLVGAGLIGLILGIIGLKKSQKAGQKNGMAIAGIVIGAVNIVVATIITITLVAAAAVLVNTCKDLGSGTHIVNGASVTCPSTSSTTYTY